MIDLPTNTCRIFPRNKFLSRIIYLVRDDGEVVGWSTTGSKLPFHFCRWILSGKIAPSVVEKQFISSPCLSTCSIVRCTSLSYLHCAEGFPFRFSSSYIIYFFVRFPPSPDNNVLLSAGEKFDWIFHQWNSTRPNRGNSFWFRKQSSTRNRSAITFFTFKNDVQFKNVAQSRYRIKLDFPS